MRNLNLVISILYLYISTSLYGAANDGNYDTTRIQHVMAKARRGEPITVGVIGGSITKGYAASSEDKRWANLMCDWWKVTFPKSQITFVNAGVGGTGTDIATHRVQSDLLKYKPDFVVIEFSVNDVKGNYASKMMEALVRQILKAPNNPGIMMLLLKQEDGTSAQESHKIIGNYYKIPMISFADLIDNQIAKDGKSLHEIFIDRLHPLDIGMSYIAQFIKDELSIISSKLPIDNDLKSIETNIPKPLYGNVFEKTCKYDNTMLEPISNVGWEKSDAGWISNIPGSEIIFKIDGNAISILYSQYFTTERGQAEVWVDNDPHKKLDAYFNEKWGPATRFAMAAENLPDGDHELHIKILNSNTIPSTGHFFEILNVQKAGNFKAQ